MKGLRSENQGTLSSTTKPIKVLSLIPTFWPLQGGAQMVLAAIAEQLYGVVKTTVLTRSLADVPRRETYEYLSTQRYWNPAPDVWKRYATGEKEVSTVSKMFVASMDLLFSFHSIFHEARNNDLIHLHFPLPLGPTAILASRLTRKPLIITVHGNADVYEPSKSFWPITRWVLGKADTVVAVGEDLADYLKSEVGVCTSIKAIPNGVDTEWFSPQSPQQNDGVLTLVSFSRLVPRKNLDVLIDAVADLDPSAPIRCLIFGTGPEHEQLTDRAQKDPRIEVRGFVSEKEKRDQLAAADIFVQLSTREGLSIATLEAMACGTPCIVADFIGVREPVTNGLDGYRIQDPTNIKAITALLEKILNERTQLTQMGAQARIKVLKKYSHEVMSEQYYDSYKQLVE